MKLDGVGLEPHECNDEFLCKRLGINRAVLTIVGVIMAIGAAVALFFFIRDLGRYGFENASPFLMIIPVLGLFFGIPAFFIYRETRAIQRELDKRNKKNNEYASDIAEMAQKSKKRALIIIICIIIIVPIIIFAIVGGSIDNHGGSNENGGDKCRNCGRETNLVAGYGYCYDCYEGFVDWQEDNWTEED